MVHYVFSTALYRFLRQMAEENELPEWNVRPIAGLKGSDLHWSTVVEENGKAKCVKGKKCALCHKTYNGEYRVPHRAYRVPILDGYREGYRDPLKDTLVTVIP
jgi:hypothetical protein